MGSLSQLRVSLADGALWAEPQLDLDATATGTLDRSTRRPNRVDAARLQLAAQGDELNAQLTGPVGLTTDAPTWPISLRATGRIARWLTRARPWYSADPWQIDGDLELAANARIGTTAFELSETRVVATRLPSCRPGMEYSGTACGIGR